MVPLSIGQAIALGVLAEQHLGRTREVAVEFHPRTDRVIATVGAAADRYELTDDGDAVYLPEGEGAA